MQQVCITRFFMQNRCALRNLRKIWKFLWKICRKWLPSSALFGIIKKQNQFASLVKRSRRSPLKAESGVRFPYEVPSQCVDLSTDGSARFFYGRSEYLQWKRKAASAAYFVWGYEWVSILSIDVLSDSTRSCNFRLRWRFQFHTEVRRLCRFRRIFLPVDRFVRRSLSNRYPVILC